MSTIASIFVRVGADITGLTGGLAAGSRGVSAFAQTTTTAGARAKAALGSAVPLAAVAGGLAVAAFAAKSVKAAVDFDAAFTRIGAISNAAASDIERWKSEVMDLSGETARAPQELADALFYLSSAGLESGQIMDTLALSAKAAAVGLGSTVDVAKITANALNAYAESGLTAAQVTDTLVAAVREGSAEPEEFAAALGRILPIASQAGVSFDEVTASLAALSNIGLDVNEGVTAMRGLMTALVAPTKESQKAIAAMGLTTDEVRRSLSEDGLIGTLRMLEEATGGNIDEMKALVPNVRALTGVFGLTGQEAAKVDAIFENVKDSTGSLGEAFKTTAESDAFKVSEAFNDIAIMGQKLAAAVLPLLASGIGAIAVISGPVIGVLGELLFVFLAYKALTFLPELLFKVGTAMAGIGVTAGTGAIANVSAGLAGVGKALGPVTLAIGGAVIAGKLLNETFYGSDIAVGQLAETFSGPVQEAFDQGRLSVEQYALAMNALKDESIESFQALEPVLEELARQAAGTDELNTATLAYIAAAAPNVAASGQIAAGHREAAAAAREQQLAELALAGGFLGLIGNAQQLADAQAEVNRLQRLGKTDTDAYREATLQVLTSGVALKQGMLDYAASLKGIPHAEVIGQLKDLGDELGLNKGDVRDVIEEYDDLLGKFAEIPKTVRTATEFEKAEAERRVNGYAAKLKGLERDSPYVATAQANTTQATNSVAALMVELVALTLRDFVANVVVTTSGGSTGFHLIEKLRLELDSLSDGDWAANVAVTVGGMDPARGGRELGLKFLEGVRPALDSLVAAIASSTEGLEGEQLRVAQAFRDTWLDQAKAFRLQAKELEALVSKAERDFERIQAKAKAFGQDIRGGFAQFDLLGGGAGLAEVLRDRQMAVLQSALAAAQSSETPDQALVDSLNAQIEALRDALIVPTAEQFGVFLADQLAQAQRFATGLQALQAAGLDASLLRDLASQGPGSQMFIDALLAGGPELIAQFNETQKAIDAIARDTAHALVDEVFGKALERAAEALDRAEGKLVSFAEELGAFLEAMRIDAVRTEVDGLIEGFRALERVLARLGTGGAPSAAGMGAQVAPQATPTVSGAEREGPTAEQIGEQVAAAIARQGGFDPRVLIREELDAAFAGYLYNTGRGRSSV